MLTTYFLVTLFFFNHYNACNITLQADINHNLITCVTGIIERYYTFRKITYVDVKYDGNEIIKIIHELPAKMTSRDTRVNLAISNMEYVIAAGTPDDFTRNFPNLMKEARWNPNAIFLIIIKYLNPTKLGSIFDVLLQYHVNDVVVVNGSHDAELYTYNPFDNYNCGKKYDKIIEFGKCLAPRVSNFYLPKLVTELRNCTFRATIAHWPPYAIDPKLCKDSEMGAEQYILKIISESEQFKVEYSRSIGGEEFSTIADNMSALGNLFMLQERKADIMFGGMMLLHFRAAAFDFLCRHLPFMDDIRILVRKADVVPQWMGIFLEFDTTVWILLLFTFSCYFMLILVILKVKDKTSLFLVMVDFFFLHGSRAISKSRGIFIMWVFFAYLISAYYQSSLVSIIANPIKSYQISTDKDLKEYNMKPCISTVIQKYISVMQLQREPSQLTYNEGCNEMIESIQAVSKSHDKFTVSLSSIFRYNKNLFYNERGEDPIYAFKYPMNSVIYAFYLYKGFPLHHKLDIYTMRLRENGLIDKQLKRLYEDRIKRFAKIQNVSENRKLQLIFPWYILVVGAFLSIGLFFLELFFKKTPTVRAIHVRN